MKNRVDSVGFNTATLQKGSNDEAGKLHEEIDALARRVDELKYKSQTAESWKYYIEEVNSQIRDLRMDTDAVPHAPNLIFDGEIFDMKPGQSTIIATPCGGGSGPEADAFRTRTSTTGPSLTLNKITKTQNGYKLDVTFGGYRQTMDYNPEDYEYQDANSDWDVIYSGPKEKEKDLSSTIVKILRVESGKIFVEGRRRAC